MSYDFKKEDDVKEFLENLGIEYRFACYQERNPEGCCLLGEYLETIKKDFKRAAAVFKSNCDEFNHGRSCYKYANYSYLGKGCTKNIDRSLSYYKKGCENKSPEACYHAGLMLVAHDQPYKDNVNGLHYFDKGCDLKNPESCYFASSVYLSGDKDVVQDMQKAFKYSLEACELQNVYACANLSNMYRKGLGVEKNEAKAEQYKTKALDIREQILNEKKSIQFGRIG